MPWPWSSGRGAGEIVGNEIYLVLILVIVDRGGGAGDRPEGLVPPKAKYSRSGRIIRDRDDNRPAVRLAGPFKYDTVTGHNPSDPYGAERGEILGLDVE